MAAPHIVVVGSANIDLTTLTDTFPRPGETIFGTGFHLGFGGKGANQAVAASLCGARVSMIARVGDDLFGPATIDNFARRGIDTTHVKVTPGVSPAKVISDLCMMMIPDEALERPSASERKTAIARRKYSAVAGWSVGRARLGGVKSPGGGPEVQ